MKKVKRGVKMVLRMILFSMIVFITVSCVENNLTDSTNNPENTSFINKWYLIRADIYNADFSQYVGEDFVSSSIADCRYLLDIYDDSCVAYFQREVTFKNNNKYNIINDTIYTDSVAFGMTYEIKSDTLIITGVDQSEDEGYIIKYRLYNNTTVPPTEWNALTSVKPDALTSFFLIFDYN